MKNLFRITIIIIFLAIIGMVIVYKYIYNKPHPDYEKAKPAYILNAKALYDEFKSNKTAANEKYNGKVIQIDGTLNKIENRDSLSIAIFVFNQGDFGDEGIRCSMIKSLNASLQNHKAGDYIKIKGYCTGYNDTDVILDSLLS